MSKSEGEETLAQHCSIYKVQVEREFRFDPSRQWRFDFAVPERKLAIEVEGGSWKIGRHQRGSGFEADCRKYNAATLQGWHLLRFTTAQVISGEAIDVVVQFLQPNPARI